MSEIKNSIAAIKTDDQSSETKWYFKLLICVVIGIAIEVFFTSKPFGSVKYLMFNIAYSIGIGYPLWSGNIYIADKLDHYISWLESPGKRFLVNFFIVVIYSIVVITAVNFTFYVWFAGQSWEKMLSFGVYRIQVFLSVVISFFFYSRAFVIEWREMAIKTEQLKAEKSASQFQALQSQVNPHFLFNSLNALNSLILTDQQLASRFTKELANIYRYVLDVKDEELVALARELNFAKQYAFLQDIRFGENIHIEMDTEGLPDTLLIAPLSLQMLLENAIKHNEISSAKPLHINIYKEGEYLVVANNIQLKQHKESSSGIGLENIRLRYQLIGGKLPILTEEENKFKVALPLLYAE